MAPRFFEEAPGVGRWVTEEAPSPISGVKNLNIIYIPEN